MSFDFPANGTYNLPDGCTIESDKINSISAAWGSLNIRHEENKNVFYLFRNNPETDKLAMDAKKDLLFLIGTPAKDFDVTDLKGNHYQHPHYVVKLWCSIFSLPHARPATQRCWN